MFFKYGLMDVYFRIRWLFSYFYAEGGKLHLSWWWAPTSMIYVIWSQSWSWFWMCRHWTWLESALSWCVLSSCVSLICSEQLIWSNRVIFEMTNKEELRQCKPPSRLINFSLNCLNTQNMHFSVHVTFMIRLLDHEYTTPIVIKCISFI